MSSKEKISFIEKYMEKHTFSKKLDLYEGISKAYQEATGNTWVPETIRKFMARNMNSTVSIAAHTQEVKREYDDSKGFINVKSLNCITLDDALRIGEVDLTVWEVDRYIVNSWETSMKLDDGSGKKVPKTVTNWQVKAWLRRRTLLDHIKFKRELLEDVAQHVTPVKLYSPAVSIPKKNMLMLSFNDLHLGRMSWHEESGGDYDSKIAIRNFTKSMDGLLTYTDSIQKDIILFIVGNDLFNYDYAYPFPRTEYGTPQTSDSRWQKMFRVGRTLMVNAIDKLSTIAPVHVMVIPGNHDPQTIFYLGEVLATIYTNNDNVHVDNSPKRRKYFEYGNNLIGASHGRKEKPADLHAIMSAEQPKSWGNTKYRYFYLGHWHHEISQTRRVTSKHNIETQTSQSEDYKGLNIDWLPNLAATDAYEFNLGLIGSIKSAKAAIHHRDKGRIAVFTHNL